MTYRALTREQEDNILYLREQYDYSQRGLAIMYGVSRTTIQRALKRAEDRASKFAVAQFPNSTVPPVAHMDGIVTDSDSYTVPSFSDTMVAKAAAVGILGSLVIVVGAVLAHAFGWL